MTSLSHVDTWIFDLDNTLYPPSIKLFEQIAARMNEMIMARMGLSLREATQLRQGCGERLRSAQAETDG